ncbi:MAG: hypothetical protein HY525_14105 [Betaproteobacteria bacterium]|nr:hypothetical protein [Betaproteobacteria bacterium]
MRLLFGAIGCLLLAFLAWIGQVTPKRAMSSYAEWYVFLTGASLPEWINSPQVDIWGQRVFILLVVLSFIWIIWPWLFRKEKIATGNPNITYFPHIEIRISLIFAAAVP